VIRRVLENKRFVFGCLTVAAWLQTQRRSFKCCNTIL